MKDPSEHWVTVVIPTRNRRDETLQTVRSALASSHQALRVAVFDNCSTDGTEAALWSEFGDGITFARSAVPLAMYDSFEAAYALVETEWVIGLGADDGLHRSAVSRLLSAALEADVDAAVPRISSYLWPAATSDFPDGLFQSPPLVADEVRSARAAVRAVLCGRESYMALPSGYASLVRNSILDQHRRRHGRLIRSWIPDLYLGFVVTTSVDRFVAVGEPLYISGTSRSSNGLSALGGNNPDPAREFEELNRRGPVKLHPRVADVTGAPPRSIQVLELETFLQCRGPQSIIESALCSRPFQTWVALWEDAHRMQPEDRRWLWAWVSRSRSGLMLSPMIYGTAALIVALRRARKRLRRRVGQAGYYLGRSIERASGGCASKRAPVPRRHRRESKVLGVASLLEAERHLDDHILRWRPPVRVDQ